MFLLCAATMVHTMLSRERAVPIKLNATRITAIDEASMHQELLGLRAALARERATLNATSQALVRERSLTRALPKLQGQLRQAHSQLVKAEQQARRNAAAQQESTVSAERHGHSLLRLRSEYASVQSELKTHREEVRRDRHRVRLAQEDSDHGIAVLLMLLVLVLPLVGVQLAARKRRRKAQGARTDCAALLCGDGPVAACVRDPCADFDVGR